MHRRKIVASIVSAGLLFVSLVSGEFPGNKVDPGGAENVGVEDPSVPSQTSIPKASTGQCNSPVQLIQLSDDGAYIPITIDGDGPYNLAISLEEESTYLFSYKFCGKALKLGDTNSCFPFAKIDGQNDNTEEDTFKIDQDEFEVEYVTLPVEAGLGMDNNSITFSKYPIKVITDLKSDDTRRKLAVYGNGLIHGIIGLKNSGDLIRSLSSTCDRPPSWGIQFQAGSFFSFGGYDPNASSIRFTEPDSTGTNNTDNVVSFNKKYANANIKPILTGFDANIEFSGIPVNLDTSLPKNNVPLDIVNSVQAAFANGATVDITISGVTFNIPWSSLVSDGVGINVESTVLTLGLPFFQYIYAVSAPSSGRQIPVFAPFTGSPGTAPTSEFQPFPDVVRDEKVPTSTRPGGGTNTSTGRPSSESVSPANGDADPQMMKSGGNNIGAIVGGVIGGVVGLLLILIAACCFYRRRKLTKGNRGVEKEYEADFDPEIGHQEVGFFPHFKESGYATLPTPPPPPQQGPRIPSLILGSPINVQYDSQTEYTPSLNPYHDDSPTRSLNATPLPPPAQTPILTVPPVSERRLSITPSLSIEPTSPISRNVSTASRQNYPGILQRSAGGAQPGPVPEEDMDDYDTVSMTSGPTYRPHIIQPSLEASSSAPRLPFNHRTDNDGGMSPRGGAL